MERTVRSQPYLMGALAGTIATLAHTGVMLAGHERSSRARREATPPRQITAAVASRITPDHKEDELTEQRISFGTAGLHFGYGATAGALYAPIAERSHERPLVQGALYGVGVWAASYLGWIPALGIPPPATRQPPQQNVTMLLAHVAWGTALGATLAWANRRRPHR